MEFEWDPAKNAANIAKHGVSFADAKVIFDGLVLETVDDRRDYGETRIAVLGYLADTLLYVVYTMRGGNRRLISARRANRDERQAYRQAIGRQSTQRRD